MGKLVQDTVASEQNLFSQTNTPKLGLLANSFFHTRHKSTAITTPVILGTPKQHHGSFIGSTEDGGLTPVNKRPSVGEGVINIAHLFKKKNQRRKSLVNVQMAGK